MNSPKLEEVLKIKSVEGQGARADPKLRSAAEFCGLQRLSIPGHEQPRSLLQVRRRRSQSLPSFRMIPSAYARVCLEGLSRLRLQECWGNQRFSLHDARGSRCSISAFACSSMRGGIKTATPFKYDDYTLLACQACGSLVEAWPRDCDTPPQEWANVRLGFGGFTRRAPLCKTTSVCELSNPEPKPSAEETKLPGLHQWQVRSW